MKARALDLADRYIRGITTALAWVAAAVIVIMSLLVAINVISRSLFNRPIPGIFEIVEYGLVWITFLGAAWLLRQDGHVRLDVLITRLGPRSGRIVNGAIYLISAVILAVFTWFCIKVTITDYRTGVVLVSELRPHKWFIEIIMPVGSLLLIVVCLLNFVKTILGRPTAPVRQSEPPEGGDGEA